MKRNRVIIAAATVVAVVSSATAAGAAVMAGPIDSAGVIHGCYYRATASGSHQVVLQDAGRRCPSGSRPISWNRVGPSGASGLLPSQSMFGVGVPDVLSAARYGFNAPNQVAFDGNHLWVANSGGNTVTEVNPSDGSVVQVLSGGRYGFNDPEGMAFDGRHMWVTNSGGNSVTEINVATGSAVRVLNGSNYRFLKPFGIVFDGLGHVWIANNAGASVTEVKTSDGSLVQVLNGLFEFVGPAEMAFDGQHLWVTDNASGTVTEINAADGSLVRGVATNGNPQDVAFDGLHMWVTNFQGTVSEIDPSTGSVVNTLTPADYGFKDTAGIAFANNHVWIADIKANTLTAIQGP